MWSNPWGIQRNLSPLNAGHFTDENEVGTSS
jgi:hypothetical protein